MITTVCNIPVLSVSLASDSEGYHVFLSVVGNAGVESRLAVGGGMDDRSELTVGSGHEVFLSGMVGRCDYSFSTCNWEIEPW